MTGTIGDKPGNAGRRRDPEVSYREVGEVQVAQSTLSDALTYYALDNLLGLVVGLAVAAQRGGPGAGIKLLQARRDLGVLARDGGLTG